MPRSWGTTLVPGSRPARPAARRPAARPRLVPLEDRSTPAVVAFDPTTGGLTVTYDVAGEAVTVTATALNGGGGTDVTLASTGGVAGDLPPYANVTRITVTNALAGTETLTLADGGAGAFDLDGGLSATGVDDVAVNADVDAAGGAGGVLIAAAGGLTFAAGVDLAAGGGAVDLTAATGGLVVRGITTTGGPVALRATTGSVFQAAGTSIAGADLSAVADAGDVLLTNANTLTGTVSASANGTVAVTNGPGLRVGDLSAGAVDLTATTGGISQVAGTGIATGFLTAAAPAGGVTLANPGNTVGTLTAVTAGGPVSFVNSQSLQVGNVTTPGAVTLRAVSGYILQVAGTAIATPGTLTVRATGGFVSLTGPNAVGTLDGSTDQFLLFRNAQGLLVGDLTAAAGTVLTTTAGGIGQAAGTAVTTDLLKAVAAGGVDLRVTPSSVATVAGTAGTTFVVASDGGLVVGTVDGTAGVAAPDGVTLRAARDLSVAAGATVSAPNGAIALAVGTDGTTTGRTATLPANVLASKDGATLTGGAGPDTFDVFRQDGSALLVAGGLPAAAPGDTLVFRDAGAYTFGPGNVTTPPGGTRPISFAGIEAVASPNATQYTFVGSAGADAGVLRQEADGPRFTLNGQAFRLAPGVPFAFDGQAGTDALTVDYRGAADLQITAVTFDGSDKAGDVLSVVGSDPSGPFRYNATYTPTPGQPGAGTVVVRNLPATYTGTIQFVNLTPVNIVGMGQTVVQAPGGIDVSVVNGASFPPLTGPAVVVRPTAGNGFEQVAVSNTGELLVLAGPGDETVTVAVATDAGANNHGVAGLTVDGQGGTDRINVTGATNLAADLTLSAETIAATAAVSAGGSVAYTGPAISVSGANTTAGGAVTFTAANGTVALTNSNTSAGGAVTFAAAGGTVTLSNADTTTTAGGAISITGDTVGLTDSDTATKAGGAVSVTGTTVALVNSDTTTEAGGAVTFAATGALSLTDSDTLAVGPGSLSFTGSSVALTNSKAETRSSGSGITVTGTGAGVAVDLAAGSNVTSASGVALSSVNGTLRLGPVTVAGLSGVTQTGAAVTLAGGGVTTLTSSQGNVSVAGAVAGTTDGQESLAASARLGTTTFMGSVGTAAVRLNALTVNAANDPAAVALGGATYAARNGQSYFGPTTVSAGAVAFTSGDGPGPVTFGGTLDAAAQDGPDVTITAGSGGVTFGGTVGQTNRPNSLTSTTTGPTALNRITTGQNTAITSGGSLTVSQPIRSVNGNVGLTAARDVTVTAGVTAGGTIALRVGNDNAAATATLGSDVLTSGGGATVAGGAGNDTFFVAGSAGSTILVDGGPAGFDTLKLTDDLLITFAGNTATPAGKQPITFVNVDRVTTANAVAAGVVVNGTALNDVGVLQQVLAGGDPPQFTLNGGVPIVLANDAPFAFNGLGGNDTLKVDLNGDMVTPGDGGAITTGQVTYDGGGQAADLLWVTAGTGVYQSAFDATYTANGTGLTPNQVVVTGRVPPAVIPPPNPPVPGGYSLPISFVNVAGVNLDGMGRTTVQNASGATGITVANGPTFPNLPNPAAAAVQVRPTAAGFVPVAVSNTPQLVVLAGGNGETVAVAAGTEPAIPLGNHGVSSLTVDGQAGTDVVVVTGATNFANNVTVTAETILANATVAAGGLTINGSPTFGNVTLTGDNVALNANVTAIGGANPAAGLVRLTAAAELTADPVIVSGTNGVTQVGPRVTLTGGDSVNATTLTSSNGTVSVAGTVDASGPVPNESLVVSAPSVPAGAAPRPPRVVLAGSVGAAVPLASLKVTAGIYPGDDPNGIELGGAAYRTFFDQTYAGKTVVTAPAVAFLSGNRSIGFTDTLNDAATGAAGSAVSLTTGDSITFGGNVGGANDGLASLLIAAPGTTVFAAQSPTVPGSTSVRTFGPQDYRNAVQLAGPGPMGFTSTGGGAVSFLRTLDGPRAVTVATGGATTFNGNVGTGTALASLTVSQSAAPTVIAPAVSDVQTTGAQSFGAAVSVAGAGATRFTSFGSTVAFQQTLDGGRDVTVSAAAGSVFRGNVGATTLLGSLTTPAGGGPTTFENRVGQVNTTGPQNYGTAVAVPDGGATTFNAVGPITFGRTLDGRRDVRVTTPADTTFAGTVGGSFPLQSLLVEGGGTARVNGVGVAAFGNQTYRDVVVLGADVLFRSASNVDNQLGSGAIAFLSTLDAAADGGSGATVNTYGPTNFAGPVGGAARLRFLRTDANVPLNPDGGNVTGFTGGSVRTTGDQTYGDRVFVGPAGAASFDATQGPVTFGQTIDGGLDVTVTTPGLTTFVGNVGGIVPLTTLRTTGGGTTAVAAGSVVAAGAQTFDDKVTVTNAPTFRAGATVAFNDTLDGPGAVTVNAPGDTTFNGAVGGATPLAALTTVGGGTTWVNGGRVRTAGDQSYFDNVVIGLRSAAFESAAGGSLGFNGTLDAVAGGPFGATLATGGAVGLARPVGATNLADLAVTAATLFGNGGTVRTTNDQTYTARVVVGGPGTLTIPAARNVTFNGGVVAPAGGGLFQTQGAGTTTFATGTAVNVERIDLTATAVVSGANVAADAVRLNAAGGGVSQVDGQLVARQLTLAGQGTYSLDRPANQLTDPNVPFRTEGTVTGPVVLRVGRDLTYNVALTSDAATPVAVTGNLTLYVGANFSATDLSRAYTAPMVQAGGAVLIVPGLGTTGVVNQFEYDAEVRGAAVQFGTPTGTAGGNRAVNNQQRDAFQVRPSFFQSIVVYGNAPDVRPGDSITPLTAGAGVTSITLVIDSATGPGDSRSGTYTPVFGGRGNPNSTVLRFFEIESFGATAVQAAVVQNGARSYQIRLQQIQQNAPLGTSVRGQGVNSNPFVVAPATVSVDSPYGPPAIAVGDVNGDGVQDLVIANGPDDLPLVTVVNGNSIFGVTEPLNLAGLDPQEDLIAQFFAFDDRRPTDPNRSFLFQGGLEVAVGDFLPGNGVRAEIAVGAKNGGGPRVQVWQNTAPDSGDDPATNAPFTAMQPRLDFFTMDAGFRGGVHLASADINGDGVPELAVGAGNGGGPRVQIFSLAAGSPQERANFFAYDPSVRTGVLVAGGRYDAARGDEILTAPGAGGAPHLKVFGFPGGVISNTPVVQASFFAFDPAAAAGNTLLAPGLSGLGGIGFGSTPTGLAGGQDILVSTGPGSRLQLLRFSQSDAPLVPSGVTRTGATQSDAPIGDPIPVGNGVTLFKFSLFNELTASTPLDAFPLPFTDPLTGTTLTEQSLFNGGSVAGTSVDSTNQ